MNPSPRFVVSDEAHRHTADVLARWVAAMRASVRRMVATFAQLADALRAIKRRRPWLALTSADVEQTTARDERRAIRALHRSIRNQQSGPRRRRHGRRTR